MTVEKLVRRDTPLVAGQTIQLKVETYYTATADDWLSGDPSVTVDEIEEDLGGKYRSSSGMAAAARRGDLGEPIYGDAYFVVEIASPEFGSFEARFETVYEEERRNSSRPLYGCEYVELPEQVKA